MCIHVFDGTFPWPNKAPHELLRLLRRCTLQKRARSPAAPMRTRTSQIVAGQLGMGENDEFV